MRIAILGPLLLLDNAGRSVEVGGPRLRTLLIRLALAGGRPVSGATLIDAVWSDAPPAGAAGALQTLVSRLRHALPEPTALTAEPTGYRLAGASLDSAEFDQLADQGGRALRAGEYGSAAGTLRTALALWRGPALADVAGADFARATISRLDERRLAATEDRIEADLHGRHDAGLIAELTELTTGHPLRERPHALLMRTLDEHGRTAEALQVFARHRTALAAALGADPGPQLTELHLALLQGPAGQGLAGHSNRERGTARAAEPGPAGRPAGNLPAALTSFVGRAAELARIDSLLANGRLVTLVGPGGAGKTRLALQAGRARAAGTRDGVWLVELASVGSAGEVPRAVADALRIRESRLLAPGAGRDLLDRLIEVLADKSPLLVLDNCEHLIDACARLADALLAACPQLCILATSREPLAITGEALCPVGPLPVPPPAVAPGPALDFPSVRLFADRAGAVRPDFRISAATVGPVVEICRRLDGLPLAIELATARLRTLPVDEIAARLGDRFRLFTGGSRTALPRHRTLRAVVEWSWEPLDEAERRLARRLAVFLDGAALPAVTEVCAADLPTLGALVEKSLVTLDEADGRYRMLETIRDYALERLAESGEADTVRQAHLRYFLRLAETADGQLRGADQLVWMDRLGAERDNLTGALRWAIDSGAAVHALGLCTALCWYWTLLSDHDEGAGYLRQALAVPGEVPAQLRGMALVYKGLQSMADGGPAAGAAALRAGISLGFGNHPVAALAEPLAALLDEDLEAAAAALPNLLDHPDPWARGCGLMLRGRMRFVVGELAAAEADLAEAQHAFEAVGDRWGQSICTTAMAERSSLRGDHAGALAAGRAGIALSEELGVPDDVALGLVQLCLTQLRAGDLSGARDSLARASVSFASTSPTTRRSMLAVAQAELARHEGDPARAVVGYQHALDLLRGTADVTSEIAFGALVGLLHARLDLTDRRAARRHFREIIELLGDRPERPSLARAAETLAAIAVARSDFAAAAHALGQAEAIRGSADLGSPEVASAQAAARTALGETDYARTYAAAVATGPQSAIAAIRAAAAESADADAAESADTDAGSADAEAAGEVDARAGSRDAEAAGSVDAAPTSTDPAAAP